MCVCVYVYMHTVVSRSPFPIYFYGNLYIKADPIIIPP